MRKGLKSLVVCVGLVFLISGAQAVVKKADLAVKKGKEVKTSVPAAQVKPSVVEPEEDKLGEYKEEVNLALANLKNSIEKVSSDNSDAKVGGQIFFRWQKYLLNGTATTPNNFDIDRAYIDIKKKLDANVSSRVTLDVARITGAARQNLFDYLKYAYVEMPLNVSSLQFVPYSVTAKLGLQHTMWIDWADKQLGLRWIAKSLLDNESVMSSSDFGVGALGKISIAGMPEIEYQGTLLNGTGYATNESNSSKAIALRLNSAVYQNDWLGTLTAAGFANFEAIDSSLNFGSGNNQFGLALSLQNDYAKVYGEYIGGRKSSSDINGFSLGSVFGLYLKGVNGFVRLDNFNPNVNSTNNLRVKSFYGVTYDWGKDVKLSADVQNSQTGNGTMTSIFYLHSSFSY
ncbi:MAG: hypothetical protein WC890_01505 [Candidatus Margulisiibacteriota bacterium]